jgi:predicted nucleic acid-binding protein
MIAAHALELGGVVYSDDRDFGRFKELKWRNPLASSRPA